MAKRKQKLSRADISTLLLFLGSLVFVFIVAAFQTSNFDTRSRAQGEPYDTPLPQPTSSSCQPDGTQGVCTTLNCCDAKHQIAGATNICQCGPEIPTATISPTPRPRITSLPTATPGPGAQAITGTPRPRTNVPTPTTAYASAATNCPTGTHIDPTCTSTFACPCLVNTPTPTPQANQPAILRIMNGVIDTVNYVVNIVRNPSGSLLSSTSSNTQRCGGWYSSDNKCCDPNNPFAATVGVGGVCSNGKICGFSLNPFAFGYTCSQENNNASGSMSQTMPTVTPFATSTPNPAFSPTSTRAPTPTWQPIPGSGYGCAQLINGSCPSGYVNERSVLVGSTTYSCCQVPKQCDLTTSAASCPVGYVQDGNTGFLNGVKCCQIIIDRNKGDDFCNNSNPLINAQNQQYYAEMRCKPNCGVASFSDPANQFTTQAELYFQVGGTEIANRSTQCDAITGSEANPQWTIGACCVKQ